MLRSYDSLAVRGLRSRPLRAALTGFGVVLGVGMVFGVLLLVGTIRHTFDDVVDSALGKTDLVITPKTGMLPSRALTDAQSTPGVRAAGGMVGAVMTRLDRNGKPITARSGQLMVAGYDPAAFPPYDFRVVDGRPLRYGRELIVERNWARDRGVDVGDELSLATPAGPRRIAVVGIFRFSNGLSLGGIGLAAMPVGEARTIMAQPSGWMQVSIAADDGADVDALRERLSARLPRGADVKTPQGVGDDWKSQLDSFNAVLFFFSAVAVFVGGFLILNSFNMTVLQRMRELGTLRTLGASRSRVARTVLLEAVLIGAAGTALGLVVGIGLAAGLVAAMRGFDLPIGSLDISGGAALTAALVGMLVTAGAAWWPARRAGRITPIQALTGGEDLRRRPGLRRLVIGLVLFVPGAAFGGRFWFGGDGTGSEALIGGVITILMFAGMALLAPFVLIPTIRVLGIPFRVLLPAGGRLAVDALVGNPLRTAATAAALTIGLSVVVVNSSMSASFVGTINSEIERSFARDFTVQAQGFTLEEGGGPGVPGALRKQIAVMPETRAVTPIRALLAELPQSASARRGLIEGIDPADYGLMDKSPVRGVDRAQALREVARGGVLLGPTYARDVGLKRGDVLELEGAASTVRAPVVGVLKDLGHFAGQRLQMSLATMDRAYNHTADAQLAVKARSDALEPALERRVGSLIARGYPNLELQSAAELKDEVSSQIQGQFNLFNGIVAIAVIVSLLGVVNTLAMSVIERTREIGVLRALGASRWKVRRTMLDESLLITISGALTGVLTGLVIAWLWTLGLDPHIDFHFPAGIAIGVAIVAVLLGVLAAILPARRAAQLDVLAALKYE